MQNITVARYEKATPEERAEWERTTKLKWGANGAREFADDWQGYIEPEDKKWILFIDIKGRPVFYPTRNKRGGVTSKPLYDKQSFK